MAFSVRLLDRSPSSNFRTLFSQGSDKEQGMARSTSTLTVLVLSRSASETTAPVVERLRAALGDADAELVVVGSLYGIASSEIHPFGLRHDGSSSQRCAPSPALNDGARYLTARNGTGTTRGRSGPFDLTVRAEGVTERKGQVRPGDGLPRSADGPLDVV